MTEVLFNDDFARFVTYGTAITSRAVTALRYFHEDQSWEVVPPDLNRAYRFGLKYAASLPLKDLQRQGTELGVSIYRSLSARDDIVKRNFNLNSADELMQQLLQDKDNVVFLWEHDADLAETVQTWLAMNDVYEFAVCFVSRCFYEDDYRGIRKAVEFSTKLHDIFHIWESVAEIQYQDFTPPPPVRSHYLRFSPDAPHA